MRTALEVLEETRQAYKNKQVLSSDEKLCIALKRYTAEVIDHILSHAEEYIGEDEQGPVMRYEQWDKLKKELK